MKNCSELLKFIQFADDTTLVFSSTNIDHLNEILQVEGNKVIKWLNANKLIINLSKTNCMLFSNKRGEPQIRIKLDDTELEVQAESTFLGVIIDNKLTWKSHIKHICNKISKSIAIELFQCCWILLFPLIIGVSEVSPLCRILKN